MEDLAKKHRRWGICFLLSSLLAYPSLPLSFLLGAWVAGLLGQGGHNGLPIVLLFGIGGFLLFLLFLAIASCFAFVFFVRVRKTPADGWRALWYVGLVVYALDLLYLLGVLFFLVSQALARM